jgi:hypothetical protein
MTIIEAIEDRNIFGALFKKISTWRVWIVVLKAIFALPMDEGELAIYRQYTGRERPPEKPFEELWLIIGRRGGKSYIVAIIVVYLAIFRDYSAFLSPGERGTIMIQATDRKQARTLFRYIKGILSLDLFISYVERETAETIDLTNGVTIEVHTASYRSVRGYTIVAAIFEESAFWRVEGANPDREIYAAIKPGMASIPGAMLIGISTPYAKQGLLYENFKEYYGEEDKDILVWKAASLTMNPTLSEKLILKERAKDPSAAASEYDAEFRSDIESFLPMEVIERVVIPGRIELPFIGKFSYHGFVDPAGGGGDSFALSIGHKENEKVVQDVLRAQKGDPHQIVKGYAEVLKKYGIHEVQGDRYAGTWVSEAFRSEGINYKASELNKSELYIEVLPYINSGMVELLDSRELVKEFRLLERRRGSSGKDTVDHPKSIGGGVAHDDLANVTAGLIVCLNDPRRQTSASHISLGIFVGDTDEPDQPSEKEKVKLPVEYEWMEKY